jgi:hypothetical protein
MALEPATAGSATTNDNDGDDGDDDDGAECYSDGDSSRHGEFFESDSDDSCEPDDFDEAGGPSAPYDSDSPESADTILACSRVVMAATGPRAGGASSGNDKQCAPVGAPTLRDTLDRMAISVVRSASRSEWHTTWQPLDSALTGHHDTPDDALGFSHCDTLGTVADDRLDPDRRLMVQAMRRARDRSHSGGSKKAAPERPSPWSHFVHNMLPALRATANC